MISALFELFPLKILSGWSFSVGSFQSFGPPASFIFIIFSEKNTKSSCIFLRFHFPHYFWSEKGVQPIWVCALASFWSSFDPKRWNFPLFYQLISYFSGYLISAAFQVCCSSGVFSGCCVEVETSHFQLSKRYISI